MPRQHRVVQTFLLTVYSSAEKARLLQLPTALRAIENFVKKLLSRLARKRVALVSTEDHIVICHIHPHRHRGTLAPCTFTNFPAIVFRAAYAFPATDCKIIPTNRSRDIGSNENFYIGGGDSFLVDRYGSILPYHLHFCSSEITRPPLKQLIKNWLREQAIFRACEISV